MAAEHWFDALHCALMREASRRGAVGAAAMLAAGLVSGGELMSEAASKKRKKRHGKGNGNGKGKRKGKYKNKSKHKPQPDPASSCSGGACAAVPEWAGDQEQIDYCEFICQQCDGADPRRFCIVEEPLLSGGTLTSVAECCDEGGECCEHECCGGPLSPSVKCCNGRCVDTEFDDDHCNGCNQRCPTGASCIDGGCRCPEGESVCSDACQECCFDVDCDNNMDCLDGTCGCGRGTKLCDGACIFENDCCTDADCPDLYTCQPCGGPPGRCCGLPPGS